MPRIYTLKSPVISSFSSNLPPRVLQLIPWAVSKKSSIHEALKRMRDEEIHTLLVLGDDSSVVGMVSESKEIALFGKKKKTKRNDQVHQECWEKCEAACADRGGCLAAHIDWDKKGNAHCTGYTCQDDISEDQLLESWF